MASTHIHPTSSQTHFSAGSSLRLVNEGTDYWVFNDPIDGWFLTIGKDKNEILTFKSRFQAQAYAALKGWVIVDEHSYPEH